MKIIGRSENGYIINATHDEVVNLLGYYSKYAQEYKNKAIGIGSEINVSDMYNQLYKLANSHDDIVRAKDALKKCIENLELVNPLVNISIKREDFNA